MHANARANANSHARTLTRCPSPCNFVHLSPSLSHRMSPWKSMVEPELQRGLIRVASGTKAIKLILQGNRAVGILCEHRGNLVEFRFLEQVGKEGQGGGGEIVLCAGVFETPKILMLSGKTVTHSQHVAFPPPLLPSVSHVSSSPGIGPEDHLREHGIRVQTNLPSVGQHLQDHMLFPIMALSRCVCHAGSSTLSLYVHFSFSLPSSLSPCVYVCTCVCTRVRVCA